MAQAVGTVYVVGAGPGDPGLITVRGAKLLRTAEAVVYDASVNPALLSLAPASAQLHAIHPPTAHAAGAGGPQAAVALLINLARQGKRVVRLAVGDGIVFASGSEEAQALARAGVPFEIAPGVSAGIGSPAYAGIPVTHGRITTGVTLIATHEAATAPGNPIQWDALAKSGTTLVLFGAAHMIRHIAGKLVRGGRAPDTPAACVDWGTYPKQRTVTATLSTLADKARETGVSAAAITIVGEVARLREELLWFEQLPLFGRRIVVTRAPARAGELVRALESLGADVIEAPTIRIEPLDDYSDLDEALVSIDAYDWMVLTSAHGVAFLFDRLRKLERDARSLAPVRVCAIGPGTARALEVHGIRADLVPQRYVAEGVVEAFRGSGRLRYGSRVLIPRAAEAREVLPEELRKLGAAVSVVPVYRTVRSDIDGGALARQLVTGEVDFVTFTSASTVRNFVELVGVEAARCGKYRVAAIGPITAAAARQAGIPVSIEAREFTIPGLVAALATNGA